MLFTVLTDYLARLESISSRNDMVVILAELFAKLKPEEIEDTMYLLTGRVAPFFLPIEFSFSTKLIQRALAEFSGKTTAAVEEEYKKVGDIGDYAASLAKENKADKLTVAHVFNELKQIALTGGSKSQTGKQKRYLELLRNSNAQEVKYITRILVGNMRLGLSTKTMFDGLSWAVAGDKSLRPLIEYAYGVSVDLGLIAKLALTEGQKALEKIQARPGTPVAAKLVEREKSAEAIIERLGNCFIQPKYDGLRVQIHYQKEGFKDVVAPESEDLKLFGVEEQPVEKVRIFSRNLESLTAMFPEVGEAVEKLGVNSLILDGEALGFDENSDAFMPFQETIKRRRKYKVEELSEAVPLQVNLFDILELNGEDLLKKRIEERTAILEQVFGKEAYTKPRGIFKLAETTLVKTVPELEALFNKYVGMNLEGIIAKDDETEYKPGTRNFDWIKLKASSQTSLVDTIDAVVLGYDYGTGLRAKFGIGAILIGLYNREDDSFVSLSRVGTGFKDSDWPKIKAALDPLKVAQKPENVVINKNLYPDVLVKPQVVVVVEADSISKSKLHGDVNDSGETIGFSLRFPRIKVFGRQDKAPEDINTVKELQQMFELQQQDFGKAEVKKPV